MDLAAVMDDVAARLATIASLTHVWPHPTDAANPPVAIVSYPEAIDFDATYGRGEDTITLPLVVAVSRVDQLAARDQLGAYCDGDGPSSVKAVLESGTYTAFDTIKVVKIEFDYVTINAVDCVAALISTEITGKGA